MITASKNGRFLVAQGETPKDIFDQLIEQQTNQTGATYTPRETGLGNSKEPTASLPLTKSQLKDLACKTWDVPSVKWQTTEDTPRSLTRGELQAIQHYLGLSISELAFLLNGINERTVRRWVAGASPIPGGISLELSQLLDAFNADVDDVVARAERPSAVTIYPADEDEQQLPERPLGWERRVLQEAHMQGGVDLLFKDEAHARKTPTKHRTDPEAKGPKPLFWPLT